MEKTEVKNEHGHLETPFDDKKALIVGDHPHAGKVARCLGADRLNVVGGFGLYFKGDNEQNFYVMDAKNVQWI